MTRREDTLAETGLDGVAVKPTEGDLSAAARLPRGRVVVDFEGREHVPDVRTLERLAGRVDGVRVTVAVRADGFDPLGDDAGYERLPSGVDLVLVAGHPAYLSADERRRAVRPRLEAAAERVTDPWVGTEGVEAAARGTGATQFLLLGPGTEAALGRLRAAGVSGDLAVYAPTVLDDDPTPVIDALGSYVRRRSAVQSALRDEGDRDAREVVLSACREFALVGAPAAVAGRVRALRDAGATDVVGYPARGLDAFAPG